VGRIGFVTQDLPGYWFSNFVQLLRPDAEKINPEYLGWILLELNRSGIIERLQHQTTQMRNLNFRDYLKVYLPKPPSSEQITIAEILQLINTALATTEAKLISACRVKTALMQQLFTRGMPGWHGQFKKTKNGEIPDDWELIKLKQTGPISSGGTPDRNNKSYFGGDILWVKSGEVDYSVIEDTEEKITPEGAKSINGELLPEGTVLVAMYGAGITRGKSAIMGKSAYINQAIASFRCNEHTLRIPAQVVHPQVSCY
jgi:type I restriction enzyme, S subunit